MQTNETWFVVCAHALLYLAALSFSRKPIVTIFHLLLVTSMLAFVIRPIIAGLAGQHTLYPVFDTWTFYTYGLIYQFFFNLCFVMAYLLLWRRPWKVDKPLIATSVIKGYWLSMLAGLASVSLIHLLSDGAWLPSARLATLTSVVPFGKILFPLAVIPLSTGLSLAYLVLVKKRSLWPKMVLAVLVIILLLSLLYQRGFVIMGLIIGAFFAERLSGLNYKMAAAIGLLAILLSFILRPIGLVFSGSPSSEILGDLGSRFKNFVLGPNFDIVDVWPVAIEFTRVVGFVGGDSLLAIPARFATPSFRYHTGLLTAVDYLNEFYYGEYYWRTNFGFNVNLAQEIYINFGPMLLIFGLVSGLLTAWIDRQLWSLKRVNTLTVYLVGAALATGGFAGEIGGAIQWALAYIGIGIMIWFVSRLKWWPKRVKGFAISAYRHFTHP